ncbi:Sugar transporter STL1 [Pyrenophora tritici-repentis]|uniref:Sugar transporter STL1 n=4 Tax=Pyrenophora tritici-repentis TaxID=45151 RepID=A0A317AL12_9PLEO|nr:sugar transporter STL1 [Pyrenophora tritici-repentis Pt-1C-BFP]EDU47505.1 sugar transporter STL1 [Pyrenophora tritici-repentis Pt-1C-BFP]KAI1511090.1 Sugar transporter STL1 [Pyrenophora tritici-repentis]KAI1668183.1 Sugar transporter STL1 [Pyrenophora tritici-repentis]KAI1681096.1 Sugar transporter STL1 [Pyrenophora tritici-repentis]
MPPRIKESDSGVPTYWGQSGRMLQVLITIVAVTDFLLFGYDQGVMSGIISAPAFKHAFPEVDGNSTYEGFVVSIYAVGCFLGACFIFIFGDKLGRRKSIFLGATVMIVGVIIQVATVPPSGGATAQFIVGRCLTGIGNGINTSTIPTYQAECCKAKNRGKVICIEGSMVAIGTLIAYWIDYGCLYGPDDFTWRFPIAFQCIFAIIVIIMMISLPESPRWLLNHHHEDEAATVLAGLNGVPRDDPEVLIQMQIIRDAVNASGGGGKVPTKALLTNGKSQHLRRAILGASSQFMQQLSGCNAVIYYFPILCQQVLGTGHNLALLLGGINMVVYAIFACTSWFLIERVGRRKLYIIGTFGQMFSMILTFACLIPGGTGPAKGAAVGLFTYIAFFGATWLPLPWLYPAEINPLKTRQKANAFSTINNWLWNFFIVMITPVLIDSISWGTYLLFAVLNACFIPVIYIFYPETSGRSLEEIDLIFAKGYTEKISYVTAAKQLPPMNEEEIAEAVRQYDISDSDVENRSTGASMKEKRHQEEKLMPQAGAQA